MCQSHPSGMFTFVTRTESDKGVVKYYHCVLRRNLPYDAAATLPDPLGVTFHIDARCTKEREFSLIEEHPGEVPHFYGWETAEAASLCLDICVAY